MHTKHTGSMENQKNAWTASFGRILKIKHVSDMLVGTGPIMSTESLSQVTFILPSQ